MKPTLHQLDVPSAWVVRFAQLLRSRGTVLDLACGGGRHARFLAARGWAVEALDRDGEALAGLEGVAGIKTTLADVEAGPWPFGSGRFDGVVVTNYLHRPLFPTIAAALKDGGVLLYETFMRGQEHLGRPSNPAFLLEPGELLTAFAGLQIVAFEQGVVVASRGPALVQRLCAVRGAAPVSIAADTPNPS